MAPRGFALMLVALVLLVGAGLVLAAGLAGALQAPERERASGRALAQAREALLSYSTDRAIDAVVGPGYLPCPDADDDGWAEPTCGSLAGDSGQAQRLGRLPWKTLGLPDLRDGHGERLWYAVSTRHKGLLNCAASRACVDMSPPAALGTLTVRDAGGRVVHDGTVGDPAQAARGGAAAVVLAPGPPLERRVPALLLQRHGCPLEGCGPEHFLDASSAPAEDNAAFHDRSDAAGRPRNTDGFIAGPVAGEDGRIVVNDRLAVIGYADLMPRVMGRVAIEAALCLRLHAAAAGHPGRYPAPVAACGSADAGAPVPFGRLPPLASLEGCNLALREDAHTWWRSWQPHVLYAPAMDDNGIDAVDAAGRVVARGQRVALVVTARPGECATPRLRCDVRGCTQVAVGGGGDVSRAFP